MVAVIYAAANQASPGVVVGVVFGLVGFVLALGYLAGRGES